MDILILILKKKYFLLFFEVGELILESHFSNMCPQQFIFHCLDKLINQKNHFEESS